MTLIRDGLRLAQAESHNVSRQAYLHGGRVRCNDASKCKAEGRLAERPPMNEAFGFLCGWAKHRGQSKTRQVSLRSRCHHKPVAGQQILPCVWYAMSLARGCQKVSKTAVRYKCNRYLKASRNLCTCQLKLRERESCAQRFPLLMLHRCLPCLAGEMTV